MIIYRIFNPLTNKSYIGQTIRSLKWRWTKHWRERNHYDHHFCRALRSYEKSSWVLEVLEEVLDQSLLDEQEIYWVAYYDSYHNGYNATPGGHSATRPKGFKLSEEHKEKLRGPRPNAVPWSKGKLFTEEHKKKLSEARLGKEPWNKGKSYRTSPLSNEEKKLRRKEYDRNRHLLKKKAINTSRIHEEGIIA